MARAERADKSFQGGNRRAAAGLCVLHIFTTARAAPTMLLIGRSADDPHVLGPLIEKFVWWSRPRLTLQVLTAGALMAALIALRGAGELSPAVVTVAVAALCLVTVLSGATPAARNATSPFCRLACP